MGRIHHLVMGLRSHPMAPMMMITRAMRAAPVQVNHYSKSQSSCIETIEEQNMNIRVQTMTLRLMTVPSINNSTQVNKIKETIAVQTVVQVVVQTAVQEARAKVVVLPAVTLRVRLFNLKSHLKRNQAEDPSCQSH